MKKIIILITTISFLISCAKEKINDNPQIKDENNLIKLNDSFVRVISKNGINLRKRPDINSEIIITIPYLTHIRVTSRQKKLSTINNIKGYWNTVIYSTNTGTRSDKEYLGWIFDGYTGSTEYKPTKSTFEYFDSGCFGLGCKVCGSKIFNPDGTYSESVHCEEPSLKGLWWKNNNKIFVCLGENCLNNKNVDIIYSIINDEVITTCISLKCKEIHISEIKFKNIKYWEPGL